MNERRFRSDLYYRLAVAGGAPAPAPRAAGGLCRSSSSTCSGRSARPGRPRRQKLRSPALLGHLARQRWSGNVRELRNYLERCVALDEAIPVGPVPDEPAGAVDVDQPLKVARERAMRAFERRYVEEMLRRHDGKVAAAARAAGVDRMHFYRLAWRSGLK